MLKILMDKKFCNKLNAIANLYRPLEACGVVLAIQRNEYIQVCDLVIGQNLAVNKVSGFRISMNFINQVKVKWCTNSSKLIGIFHTHGIGSSSPSIHDRLSMKYHPGIYIINDTKGNIRAFKSSLKNFYELNFI